MVNVTDIVSRVVLMVDSGYDLKNALYIELSKYKIEEEKYELSCENINLDLLKRFIQVKKFEGLSDKTLEQYWRENNRFFLYINKRIADITNNDIKSYLAYLQVKDIDKKKNVSMTTIANAKSYVSAFFNWLDDEGYIEKSPARNLKSVKRPKTERKAFTDCELDIIRKYVIDNKRDKAIIELLLSTGCRVGELVEMTCNNINWMEKSILVTGKGNKQRYVYFDDVTAMYLDDYLKSRNDNSISLFVTSKGDKKKLEISSVEDMIRDIGKACNIHAYPHKFRRTFATRCLRNGMPIATLSKLMGHEKIETTMIYCDIDKSMLNLDYRRYAH